MEKELHIWPDQRRSTYMNMLKRRVWVCNKQLDRSTASETHRVPVAFHSNAPQNVVAEWEDWPNARYEEEYPLWTSVAWPIKLVQAKESSIMRNKSPCATLILCESKLLDQRGAVSVSRSESENNHRNVSFDTHWKEKPWHEHWTNEGQSWSIALLPVRSHWPHPSQQHRGFPRSKRSEPTPMNDSWKIVLCQTEEWHSAPDHSHLLPPVFSTLDWSSPGDEQHFPMETR